MLVALDSPGEEMRLEMRGQMAPDGEALERLREEVTNRRKALAPTLTPNPNPNPQP